MNILQDVRYALRGLFRSPGFTTVAVLTLALGIGANVTLFSMLDAVLFRPLPFSDPDRVVEIWGKDIDGSGRRVPGPIVDTIRQRSTTIEGVITHGPDGGVLQTKEGPVRIAGRHVSANFLNVLGVQPFMGRGFLPHEDDPAARAVAVVSFSFWQTRLAGEKEAIGQTIVINTTPYTVIGIMPPRFTTSFQRRSEDFWTTHIRETVRAFEREIGHEVIARLSPDVTIADARAELQAITASVEVSDPDWRKRGRYVDLLSKKSEMIGDAPHALQLLLIAVAVVLMIACANLALLSLARSDRRVAEFPTRKAIGAPMSQLFRLALTESLLIAIAGAGAGLMLSYSLLPAMLALAPSDLPRIAESTIDWRVLGLALGLGLATACVFGTAPALRLSRLSVLDAMKGLRGTPSRGSARLRALLVAGQVAASVALLVIAGLIGQTFLRLLPTNPGFESRGRTVFYLNLPAPDRQRVFDGLKQRLEATPGIREVGFGLNVPFSGDDDGFRRIRDVQTTREQPPADVRSVSANYFALLNTRLLTGRNFAQSDRAEVIPRVAIVNATLARQLAPGGDVLGRRI
jgi:predicted permease